jgi:integrin alpha FG-GAP repeat containing protein 1
MIASYSFKAAANNPIIKSTRKITNIVPGDFNYDGRLDLLVMSQTNPGSWFDDQTTHLELYTGKGDRSFDGPTELPASVASQPMLVDAQGDMTVNLLGFTQSDAATLKLWKTGDSNASLSETSVCS